MILHNGSCEEAGMNPDKLRQYEAIMKASVENGDNQAIALFIARKGVVVLDKGFGHQTHEDNSPKLQQRALFPMSSITKPVTATAVMMLYEEGRLDIEAPVNRYVPEFRGPGKEKVCVHHLMTHSSGIRDEDIWRYADENKDRITPPEPLPGQHPAVAKSLFYGYEVPLWKSPGEEMSYCSYGVELLGEIIRRVSGQSYESFVRERIFRPLGMNNSYLIVPENAWDRVVKRRGEDGYDYFTDPLTLAKPSAAGGLYSTACDMGVFLQMYLNKGIYGDTRILSERSVEDMTKNQIPGLSSHYFDEFFEEAGWGYCWDIPYGKKTAPCGISPASFLHGGASGVIMMADPAAQLLIAAFFVLCKRIEPQQQVLANRQIISHLYEGTML